MSKTLLILFLATALHLDCHSQKTISLAETIENAKSKSSAVKQSETKKTNGLWQFRFYKSNYNPQLKLTGNLPQYSKLYQQNRLDDGTLVFQSVEQVTSNVSLGIEQPITVSGGTISINTSFNNFKDYAYDLSRWSGSLVNISLSQPIFSFNPLKWDKKIEPLKFEESKRQYIEELESISEESVNLFFNVLQEQVNLQIALFNLTNNDTIYKIENGRYNLGTSSLDRLMQVEIHLFKSEKEVAQAKLAFEMANLELRSYIGIASDESIELLLPEEVPIISVNQEEALQYARTNRASYIAFERRRREIDKEIAQAKGQRFNATLYGTIGLNNSVGQIGEIYKNPSQERFATLAISIPIIDWGRNRSRVQTAIANKQFNEFIIAQDELNFEREIIVLIKQFKMLKLQIDITKKTDLVATERYKVAQKRYLIGKIDITNLNIALSEKDDAKRSYIQALKDYWLSYYRLRRLTHFDFATNKPILSAASEGY